MASEMAEFVVPLRKEIIDSLTSLGKACKIEGAS